jgi:hypothetical protein
MTATQISPRPRAGSPPDLVCRPLIVMASRGFDRACLLQMQDAAFRYAAQSLQYNKSSRDPSAPLWAIVDTRLGGPGQAQADLSPGHIAAYMRTKAFYSQLQQRDALFDVAVLASAPLGREERPGPRTRWLTHMLVGLQRAADRLSATTPMFATEVAAQVRRTVEKHAEISDLSLMTYAGAAGATPSDEEQVDADEYPRIFLADL